MTTSINIEIAYAYPDKYFLKKLIVEQQTTVQAAILQSGILQQYAEIDLRKNKIGIFSRPVKLTDIVSDGDRIEIYRPLLADPKEIRRQRAEQQAKEAENKKSK
ncbi:RnfH family protein [Pasteurellaceae bacterium 22721_9_1]